MPLLSSRFVACTLVHAYATNLTKLKVDLAGFQSRDTFDTWMSTLNGNTVNGLS